jgi:O-antigen biosynthesis protein
VNLRTAHRIAPGIHGWLESPAPGVVAPDCVTVSGWVFVHGAQIVELWATAFGARCSLRRGSRRDDVARAYPDEPGAAASGFSGYLEFTCPRGARGSIEVWARLTDGRSVNLFKRRVLTRTVSSPASLGSAVWQVVDNPRMLLSGRAWLGAFRMLGRPRPARTATPPPVGGAPTTGDRAMLVSFLADGSRLTFAPSAEPVVSVVVVVWNHADLSLACLRALAAQADATTEVIIVDNASTDETADLLSRLGGAVVIRNATNLGFTMALNIGAKAARGEYLLFVNNDAVLGPETIQHLLKTVRRSSAIGAVGGKLVYPDGRLQEAGSIIWADGSCDAYGRGGDPAAPEFNFEREVDFCSAALLITPRPVFERLGGFDERYRPAYYDDADYCARLWSAGLSVVYQPRAAAIHCEFGSTSPDASADLQRGRRPIFVSTHARWLSSQHERHADQHAARSQPHGRPCVLVVDDAVPDPRKGAGFPRAAALLETLEDLGYRITLYVTAEDPSLRLPHERFPAVEIRGGGPPGLRAFLASARRFQMVIVSRPHNMQYVKAAVGTDLSALGVPCLYDAEALYAMREIGRRGVFGEPVTDAEARRLIDEELALARGCAGVLAVNEAERQLFAAAGIPHVSVLGHAVEPRPTPHGFEQRETILFVGAFGQDSPNEDALTFFCRDVLPALRAADCHAPVAVSGAHLPGRLEVLAGQTASWQPDVDDLTPLYAAARVFVAPTRYAAGISLKVIEAAARGVPVVCTPLVAEQLGWDVGVELLAAETAEDLAAAIAGLYGNRELWLRLRDAALKRVARDCSPAGFRSTLSDALRKCLAATR